jgi:AraC-like DNA-binding protein
MRRCRSNCRGAKNSHEKITIFRSTLKRASFRLAFEDDKRVIDIALEAGFESPEAFSRAFRLKG